MDCWVDDANARLADCGQGVRCSLELLDPYDALDAARVQALLDEAGASLGCGCDGALAIDPDTDSLVLVGWLPEPCTQERLLALLESLANQRAALLVLMHASLGKAAPVTPWRGTLNYRPPGV